MGYSARQSRLKVVRPRGAMPADERHSPPGHSRIPRPDGYDDIRTAWQAFEETVQIVEQADLC